jgi:hypothetical protein
LLQSVIEGQQFGVPTDRESVKILDGDPAPSIAFAGPAFAGVVHQDLAHEPGGNGNEMRAILEVNRLAAQQTHVGLMHQGCALQRVVGTFGLKMVVGQTAKLFVNQRHEIAESFLVALRPVVQELGYLTA